MSDSSSAAPKRTVPELVQYYNGLSPLTEVIPPRPATPTPTEASTASDKSEPEPEQAPPIVGDQDPSSQTGRPQRPISQYSQDSSGGLRDPGARNGTVRLYLPHEHLGQNSSTGALPEARRPGFLEFFSGIGRRIAAWRPGSSFAKLAPQKD